MDQLSCICVFCQRRIPITFTGSNNATITCTSCDKVAIATERLATNAYPRLPDGEYTDYSKWLRSVDVRVTSPPQEEEPLPVVWIPAGTTTMGDLKRMALEQGVKLGPNGELSASFRVREEK